MKYLTPVFVAPFLLANGFPPEKYELSAKFAAALVRGDLTAAQRMLVPRAKIYEWADGEASLDTLAAYVRRCPIKSIEGNKEININIMLDCGEGYHSVSLEFRGTRIQEVNFGPPPVRPTNG